MSDANKLIIAVVVIVLGIFGFFLYNTANQKYVSNDSKQTVYSSTSSQPGSQEYTTLSPASVSSKVAECSQAISFSSNGDSGPVQCSNGDLNVKEWQSLAALEPTVLTLGYNASSSQVQSALCNDVKANISNPIELTAYQMASLYYGWSFSPNPTSVITNGACVNKDD